MSAFTLDHETPVKLQRSAGAPVEISTVGAMLDEMCERDTFVINGLGGGYAVAMWNNGTRDGETYLFPRRYLGRRYLSTASGSCVAFKDTAEN